MKMIEEIAEGVKWAGASCIENAYATIMDYYGDDSVFLLGETLEIHIDPRRQNEIAMIEIPIPEIMTNVFGYQCHSMPVFSFEKVKGYLEEGVPVLAEVDTYGIPYLRQYGKYHYSHVCLLRGYDEKYLYCTDPNVTVNQEKRIETKALADCYVQGYAFRKDRKDGIDYHTVSRDIVHKITQETYMQEYDLLIGKLKNIAAIRHGIAGYAPEDMGISPLFLQVRHIAGKHWGFIHYMEYCRQKYGDNRLGGLESDLNEIVDGWENYRLKLIHLLLTEKLFDEKLNTLYSYLDSLYDMEERWRDKVKAAWA